MSIAKKVQQSGLILGGLGVIGFIGIVWLMIYGNLSGNLGFQPDADLVVNFTGGRLNDSNTFTIAEKSNNNFTSWSVGEVWNSSDVANDVQILLNTSEYIVDATAGTITNGSNTVYPVVNITYTVTVKRTGELNAEAVIDNVSGGFGTFFTFSNTFFTIAAIVLLIFMLVGLLAIVMLIAKGNKGDKNESNGPEFVY